jgi:hypothetical protein
MSTLGAEELCSAGGLFLAGEAVLSTADEDDWVGEATGLITGIAGRGGDADFSTCGIALELEACSGTRGALRKKSKLEVKKERNKI